MYKGVGEWKVVGWREWVAGLVDMYSWPSYVLTRPGVATVVPARLQVLCLDKEQQLTAFHQEMTQLMYIPKPHTPADN